MKYSQKMILNMSKKVLRILNELAQEIYGKNVFVDTMDFNQDGKGDQYVDIYTNTQQEAPILSVMHPQGFEIMIELLRIIKRRNNGQ